SIMAIAHNRWDLVVIFPALLFGVISIVAGALSQLRGGFLRSAVEGWSDLNLSLSRLRRSSISYTRRFFIRSKYIRLTYFIFSGWRMWILQGTSFVFVFTFLIVNNSNLVVAIALGLAVECAIAMWWFIWRFYGTSNLPSSKKRIDRIGDTIILIMFSSALGLILVFVMASFIEPLGFWFAMTLAWQMIMAFLAALFHNRFNFVFYKRNIARAVHEESVIQNKMMNIEKWVDFAMEST
ncbi:hypothetical protein, partial [Kocuria subflava]|uniref:hypothetical protein n=2 Tax=Kocuria TaxID=57493 RepID=UPI001AE04030